MCSGSAGCEVGAPVGGGALAPTAGGVTTWRPSMGARTGGGRSWASWTSAVVRAGRMGMWWAARRQAKAVSETCWPGLLPGKSHRWGEFAAQPEGWGRSASSARRLARGSGRRIGVQSRTSTVSPSTVHRAVKGRAATRARCWPNSRRTDPAARTSRGSSVSIRQCWRSSQCESSSIPTGSALGPVRNEKGAAAAAAGDEVADLVAGARAVG